MTNSLGWALDNFNNISWRDGQRVCLCQTGKDANIVMGLVDKFDQLVAACDKAEGQELKDVCRKILGIG